MINFVALPFALVNAALDISEPVLDLGLGAFFRLSEGISHLGNLPSGKPFEGKVSYLGPKGVRNSQSIRVYANNSREAGRLVLEKFDKDHYDLPADFRDLQPSALVRV